MVTQEPRFLSLYILMSCIFLQMAVLLHSPKTLSDVTSLMKSCDSLNSAQLRTLLCNYYPAPGERTLSSELVGHLVMNAASTVDAQLQEEGRDISVEEPSDLGLPFLVPEDGYSCEFVRGMPAGLVEFVDHFVHAGQSFILFASYKLFMIFYTQQFSQSMLAGKVIKLVAFVPLFLL